MMVDEKETTNGHGFDLNCSIGLKIEAEDNGKGRLLLDGSNGGVSFGDGNSAERFRIYTRRKRKSTSYSDEITKVEFDDKIKDADGCALDQDKQLLSIEAFPKGLGDCSLRHCRNIVLQQTHQPLNEHENGPVGYHQESGCMSVIKKALDNVKRGDNQTNNSAPELSHVMTSGLLKQSDDCTSSELCCSALSDILNSEKFSELCGLLRKNFGVVNVNQVLDIDAISLKINNGVYETSPIIYLKDIQQVWTKLQQVGNEMAAIAKNLSDKSRTHYEQIVRKPRTAEAHGCQGCGEKADVRNCLVCDSCEDIYHLSCSELVGTEIPPSNWYCASCVSNGIGSPHDKCIVCERLKPVASTSLVNGIPTTDESQNVPNGLDQQLHDVTDQNHSSNICFICKYEVKIGDNFRTCGHSECSHKFYHYKCLDRKQLGVSGPCWYCPSCLCRQCLVDKDDDQIVLCDGCDEAYHMYCAKPQLHSVPKGNWFCRKCDRQLKQITTMRLAYESMQKKVKIEDASEKTEPEEPMNEREGLDMLVTAAKTLSHRDTLLECVLKHVVEHET
ncbi:hypothetical protein R6Q59_020020 [Mikania micrantha]|uniref:PHD-type domain-containing protein n=1 Tax=Mikania micrantha TaxID=192012 RepID=A0A5N6PRB4_9ASTR|nr:hypothetical protein E3N88_06988 [Mikania micrantha]